MSDERMSNFPALGKRLNGRGVELTHSLSLQSLPPPPPHAPDRQQEGGKEAQWVKSVAKAKKLDMNCLLLKMLDAGSVVAKKVVVTVILMRLPEAQTCHIVAEALRSC